MFWITKTFECGAAWSADQDKFATLQLIVAAEGNDHYRKMIMSNHCSDMADTVYIGLPRSDLAVVFPDYKPLKGELPQMTCLLGGEDSEWRKHISILDLQPN